MEISVAQFENLITLAVQYGMQLIYAVFIAVAGFWIAGFLSRRIYSALKANKNVDDTLAGFASSFVKYSIATVVVLAVLQMFGIETTSLIAVLGAASLAIGLALQGTLSSFAAGVMLLIFRPFKVGHVIEVAGFTGEVRDITIFTTELATPNNVQIIVPNKDVWGAAVTNFSANVDRRADIVALIDNDADLEKAIAVIEQVIRNDERVLKQPLAPAVEVSKLGERSIELTAQVWTRGASHDALKADLTRAIKTSLRAAGIAMPKPMMDVPAIAAA